MASSRYTYDPSNLSIEHVQYAVAKSGDPWFVAAYPQMFEEQRNETEYFSENGTLSTNGKTRDLTKGVAWTEARFAAYKAAMLAQNRKLVPSIAEEVVPATNEITYESVGEENVVN